MVQQVMMIGRDLSECKYLKDALQDDRTLVYYETHAACDRESVVMEVVIQCAGTSQNSFDRFPELAADADKLK